MEFIIHMSQDIDKNGALWQIWNSFYQKATFFQSTELYGPELSGVSSLLLFAARDQISSICSTLKMYDLDLPKLNSILQVVEQICLPYFILMFERFRYFNLKRDLSDSLDDFFNVLRKQAEMCEFGNQEEIIMKNALCSSLESESLMQFLSNKDGLLLNDMKAQYSGAESQFNKIKGRKSVNAVSNVSINRTTGETNHEIFGLSSNDILKSVNDTSSCIEFSTSVGSADCSVSYSGNEQHKISDQRKISRQNTKQNTLKTEMSKIKREETLISLPVEDMELESDFTNFENNEDTLAESCNKISNCNQKLVNTKSTVENVVLRMFPCCLCAKAFAGDNCLKKHLASKHKDCKIFSCKVCTSVFGDADEYILHYKLVHYSPPKNFLCWNCGESLQNLSDYKQHGEKHEVTGKFTCDLCHRQHRSIFMLLEHLRHHLMPTNKCEICGAVFIKPESLARHIQKHTDEPIHKCPTCGRTYFRKDRLHSHMKIHKEERNYTCELCGKTYAHKLNLVHHKLWHKGEKPFSCDICGKRTRCSGDLSKHKRIHSDKRPYVCEVCGKGFTYCSSLVRHRMGHTGQRAFACDACGRTFIYSDCLRDHIRANRCPGSKSEPGSSRTRKPTKLLKSGMSYNPLDTEVQVYTEINSGVSETDIKDIQEWHCILRKEAEEGAVVLVTSFY